MRNRQRGVATVEAAIGIPLLLFLMLAGVELGRAFVQYTVLSDASRNAARHAAEEAMRATQRVSITPQLITETRNLVVYGNEAGSGPAILPGLLAQQVTLEDAGNDNVRIAVSYPFQSLFGAQLPTFGHGSVSTIFTMNIVVTMRAL